ncbi:MAG: Fe-S cluster assembly protein SufD, partial [Microbacteriaceae bacterium]
GQFGIRSHSDGNWDNKIPVQTRSERFKSFEVKDFPSITGREAFWKFTPIAEIEDLANGELDGSAYPFALSEDAYTRCEWISREDTRIGTAGIPEDRVSANAWSQFDQALHLELSGVQGAEIVLSRNELGKSARAAHTLITAKAHSNNIVVIDNQGSANIAENLEVVLEDNAQLTVISVHNWDEDAHQLASHFARVGRDAQFTHIVVSFGGRIVRVNPSTWLAESGASTEMFGLYFADAHQHLEHQVFVHHDAPHSRSRVSYKGALQGTGAHTVWIGDVLIARSAPGTDSYEENRNLMLTDGTRADSIPNLEIETGDIAGAGHASATGRFDDEQLFYLQARGIPEEEARRLVVHGFLQEIITKIPSEHYRELLGEQLEREIAEEPIR